MDVVSPIICVAAAVVRQAFSAKQLRDDCVELGKLVEKLKEVLVCVSEFLNGAGHNSTVTTLLRDVDSTLQEAAALIEKIQKYNFARVAIKAGFLVERLSAIKEQLRGSMDRLMGIGNLHMTDRVQQELKRSMDLLFKNFQKQLRNTDLSQIKEVEAQIAGLTRTVEVFQSRSAHATQEAMRQFKADMLAEMRDLGHLVKGSLVSREEVEQALKQMQEEVKQCKERKQVMEDHFMAQLVAAISLADGGAECSNTCNGSMASSSCGPSSAQQSSPPHHLLCPIGLELMDDPVMLVESGQVFDQQHITEYLSRGNRTCPITRTKLHTCQLVPVYALRSAVDEWKAAHIHQSGKAHQQSNSYGSAVTPWPPSTAARPIHVGSNAAVAEVRTLEQLCAVLEEGHKQVVDLGGRTLEGGSGGANLEVTRKLVLSKPGLVLRNGGIKLPEDCSIEVTAAGEGVELQDLVVHGSAGAAEDPSQIVSDDVGRVPARGLITVTGLGAKLAMHKCEVHLGGGSAPLSGVLVEKGAYARITHSKFATTHNGFTSCFVVMGEGDLEGVVMKGYTDGLVAWGQQAICRARECWVEETGAKSGWGFAAHAGGTVYLTDCTALRCGEGFAAGTGGRLEASLNCCATKCFIAGFLSKGNGSVLVAGSGCVAQEIELSGYLALQGGRLEAGYGCRSLKNEYGFLAQDPGSSMICGKDCVADGNQWSGFKSMSGAKLEAGEGCQAINSTESHGFMSVGSGSSMICGRNCVANGNNQIGFYAANSGRLEAGEGCKAINQREHHGFNAEGDGSTMTCGPMCMAHGNKREGFLADDGGRLEAGQGCQSMDNYGNGFVSNGPGSVVMCGKDCVADGNQYSGFKSTGGGKLEADEGCQAINSSESHGFAVAGKGSLMTCSRACVAKGNNQVGFYAVEGGRLEAGEGCKAINQREHHGFNAEGDGSTMACGPMCVAQGNNKVGFLADAGGRLEASKGCQSNGNHQDGFCSLGPGSLVVCGKGCVAEGNQWSGFKSFAGATLEVGEGCQAINSCSHGFTSGRSGSLMVCGRNCVARENTQVGFYASSGGRLEAGEGCKAINQREHHGFNAEGDGSTMACGPMCMAQGNKRDGFLADDGGRLEAGQGCQSMGNHQDGFCSVGSHSVVMCGMDCVADGNQFSGFKSFAGGRLEAGEGCQAINSESHGFVADGSGSLMDCSWRCVARKNKQAGFYAVNGGRLEAGRLCQSKANYFGFVANEAGSLLIHGTHCIAEGNTTKQAFLAWDGGWIQAR